VEKGDGTLEEGHIEDLFDQLWLIPNPTPNPQQVRVPSEREAGGQLY
jgi:hypothetical protein